MKKSLFLAVLSGIVVFISPMMNALYKTRVFLVNRTSRSFVRSVVVQEKGEKVAPKYKTRIGKHKVLKIEGMDCNKWKCVVKKRVIIPSPVKPVVVSSKSLEIKPNFTVKIAEIDRDQASLKSINWEKALRIKNPNPGALRPTLLSRVYPYEKIVFSINSPVGSVDFDITSERIGLPKAFAVSAAATVGFVGTSVGAFVISASILASEFAFMTIPAAIFAGGFYAGVMALALTPLLAVLDQKSGLIIDPKVKGYFKISYKTKLRFGNIYKDVYIIVEDRKR